MSDISRRGFLKHAAGGTFIAAGGIMSDAAGMTGKSLNKLIPYVIPDENVAPGVWNFLATTCRECPAGCGMHLWHRDGRVTKAEGIPDHPVNRGGLCARGQSALQGLYDPDRLKQVVYRSPGRASTPENPAWAMAIEEIGNRIKNTSGKVAFMSNLQTGSLAELMKSFVSAFGSDRLVFYEPFNYEPLRAAHEAVFGQASIPDYRLDACSFVISFAADFLESWLSSVDFAGQFGTMHAYNDGSSGRLAYVGPRLSLTAANADEFIQCPVGGEYWVAMAMLVTIVRKGWARADTKPIERIVGGFDMAIPDALAAIVSQAQIEDFANEFVHAPASVALAGPVGGMGRTAYGTAVAAALLNWVSGRVGQTVDFSRCHAVGDTARHAQVRAFLESLTNDDVLFIHESNPVYSIKDAAEHIRRAGSVVYMGTMPDETAELATWVLPANAPLESWGDFSPKTGIHCLLQPTMAPLYDTMHAGDILLGFTQVAEKPLVREGANKPAVDFKEWLEQGWQALAARVGPEQPFEDFRRNALRTGWVSEAVPQTSELARPEIASMDAAPASGANAIDTTAQLWAWPSVMLFDGRVANRGWLQEAPDPTSFMVWGSWVDIHPQKAASLGLAAGQVVQLETESGVIEAPVHITDDVSPGVVAIAFGQGHTALGRNAANRGANVFHLFGNAPGDGPFPLVTIRKTERQSPPVCVSATQDQHGRGIVQWITMNELGKMKPGDGENLRLPLPEGYDPRKDLYAPHEYKEHRWAMAVDLARCIGCGACAVACYAENNIPVRGERRLREGREAAWLQVVPYRDPQNARRLGFLPLMCQHCDAAPCEPVCPVFASVHNEEGLNAQIYNRCIGTRYCSNNCPYKVRRFNWLDVKFEEPLNLQLNPEVSVRCRGVMEKCTFCIQRIRQAEHRARLEDRAVRDGEVQPACAQSCPTRAIIFGDLLDAQAKVTQLTRLEPRRYHVLEQLNTKSAVTYLRRIKESEMNKGSDL